MTFYFAMLMFFTDGESIYDLPDWFTATISPLGIPFPVAVAAFVLIITAFLLNRLSIGRQIYGLGGNLEGAKRMGCNILGLQCFVYGYSGLTAGIAGLVQAHRVEEVVPNALIGRELDVLAAVVLGGASLQGGIGTVTGAILGIVFLRSFKMASRSWRVVLLLRLCDRHHHSYQRERDGPRRQAPAKKDHWQCRLRLPPPPPPPR